MKTTAFVSHYDCSRHDTGWGHPDHQGRLPALMRRVHADMLTLFDPLLEVEGRHASEDELRLAHADALLDRVRGWVGEAAAADRPLEVQPGLVVSGASWDAAAAAVGSALTAVDVVLAGQVRNAFCAIRPPGRDAAVAHVSGHSLFNSVAVAVRYLMRTRDVANVLVVEWGGPSGLGTAEIIGSDPGVAMISVHEAPAPAHPRESPGAVEAGDAPGEARRQGASGQGAAAPGLRAARRPLAEGAGGDSFIGAQDDALFTLGASFHPDFVVLSAGFDGLAADPLGRLSLTPGDYHEATLRLRRWADSVCGGRLVSILEGGYDAAGLGAAAVQHLRALADLPPAEMGASRVR